MPKEKKYIIRRPTTPVGRGRRKGRTYRYILCSSSDLAQIYQEGDIVYQAKEIQDITKVIGSPKQRRAEALALQIEETRTRLQELIQKYEDLRTD